MEFVIFTVVYAISFIMSRAGLYILSGILLMAAAVALSIYYYLKYGRRVCPPAVFSISWIGGVGVSCLKLSYLETDWESLSWIAFYLAYAAFILGYKAVNAYAGSRNKETVTAVIQKSSESTDIKIAYIMLNAIAVISLFSLTAEALILGYIPLFTTDTPHAYSYFHVSGLHYFTVSCVLLPALGALILRNELEGRAFSEISVLKRADVTICMGLGLFIPILLVSRYQLFCGILLAAAVMLISRGARINIRIGIKQLFAAFAVMIVMIMLYVFITYERAHSIEYLNGIFEMKNKAMPIFISQPYIYIANNFDNFNCLVRELEEHTHGLRMLFPVFALSGLKFLHPELVAFPIYVTKEELTTVTLIYDSFYDFGIVGVFVFCFIIAAAAAIIERRALRSNGDIFAILLYAQISIYLLLSFFTTWFSNPTTWFYFGITAIGGTLKLFSTRYFYWETGET